MSMYIFVKHNPIVVVLANMKNYISETAAQTRGTVSILVELEKIR